MLVIDIGDRLGQIFVRKELPPNCLNTNLYVFQTASQQTLPGLQQRQGGTADIGNIASSVMASVQPQLEALQKAMEQKGMDPVQMAQLTQAMNTLQSFVGKFKRIAQIVQYFLHKIFSVIKSHNNHF